MRQMDLYERQGRENNHKTIVPDEGISCLNTPSRQTRLFEEIC